MSRDALIVGLNTYTYLRKLNAPAEDAEAIARCLEQQGEFRVWRLPEAIENSKPRVGKTLHLTLPELQRALVQLFKPSGRQIPDTALFYFSGHGVRYDAGIQEGYLATSDVNPDQGFCGLSLRWLRQLLKESPVRQQIIWLDCCHSGELLNFDEADPGDQGRGRDRCFIAASRASQVAYEEMGSVHSVLTRALLSGLDPKRLPDRWIDNLVLTDFINQALKGAIQSPVCNNSGEPINLTRSWEVADQPAATPTEQGVCPYKGLTYFDCNDEDPKYFYGRTALTDQLLDQVRQSNFLAIVGASGSGKSSVLRAGLLHQLKVGRKVSGSDQWQIKIMVPGEHPLQNLALTFVDTTLPSLERAEQLGRAEGLIREGAEGLRRLVQTSGASRVVLVIDQFEEAFTLCQDVTERQQFFACILNVLNISNRKLCLILGMRADFFGKCLEQEYSGLAKQIEQHLVAVPPMSREELQEAIEQPAKRVELAVEPELSRQMLEDVEGSPGSLPLLQYTLTEIWKQQTDGCLRLTAYLQLGRVAGTLQKRATEVYESFPDEQRGTVKHIFLALTQLGEGTEDTRRRVLKADLVNAQHSESGVDVVLKRLADEKLVVTSEIVGKGIESGRAAVVDVAHEALIRHWSLLRKWLEESRDLLRQSRKMEALAEEWRMQGKKSDYLLQGRQLLDAKGFQKQYRTEVPLSALVNELIERSTRKRRNNRLALVGLGMITPLGLAIFVGVQINNQINKNMQVGRLRETVEKEQTKTDSPSRIAALQGLNRLGQSLENIQLSDKNLSGVQLSSAIFMNANLNGANLNGANLSGANLSDAELIGAELSGANLSGAKLDGAKLDGANLSGANLGSVILSSVILSGANLSGANLDGAELIGANLRYANLSGANLSGANLSDTNLSDTNLSGADLRYANLSYANLSGAILLTTNLRNARDFDPFDSTQLREKQQLVLCHVALPEDFKDKDKLKDRDCDLMPQEFLKRDPKSFKSLEAAKKYVDEARQRKLD